MYKRRTQNKYPSTIYIKVLSAYLKLGVLRVMPMMRPPMRPAMGMVMIQLGCGISNCSRYEAVKVVDLREQQKTNTAPVDGLEWAVAETDTDGGSSDTHGGWDGQLVLREDEDSDGSTQFHGGTTRRWVVGDLVAHDCQVVSMRDQRSKLMNVQTYPSWCCNRM